MESQKDSTYNETSTYMSHDLETERVSRAMKERESPVVIIASVGIGTIFNQSLHARHVALRSCITELDRHLHAQQLPSA